MNSELKEDHFLPVAADSTQKKFTTLIIIVSLIVFVAIYLITTIFVPPMYLEVVGDQKCPSNTAYFTGFCHHFNIRDALPWYSNVFGLNRTNSLLLLGGRFVLPEHLKSNC